MGHLGEISQPICAQEAGSCGGDTSSGLERKKELEGTDGKQIMVVLLADAGVQPSCRQCSGFADRGGISSGNRRCGRVRSHRRGAGDGLCVYDNVFVKKLNRPTGTR